MARGNKRSCSFQSSGEGGLKGSLVWMNMHAGVCPEGVSMSLGRLKVRLTFALFLKHVFVTMA